ncbi:outer membrane protein assembly factor BamE [Sphingomonas flavalba]|uniref:outer membrane protein assembly factor BamE n=1 Tax=Sphingomonas flavalba TaxID=2559804 RepID=UPI0014485272|nr:outer membrane protein assembly factor BamE [Sphingomonas flavalba]
MTRRAAPLAVLLLAAGTLGGCAAQIRGHQGYFFDQTLVSTVQPGIDNKESVDKTLGRPTFAGQFTDNDWYYFSRDTRQLAFSQPRPTAQEVLHVSFDKAGNVAKVEKTGLDQIASIKPFGKTTPTLGRKRGFFQDLFGNIGRVGAVPGSMGGGAGGTTP